MSLPTYYYRCTVCDFSQSSGIRESDTAKRIYDLGGSAVAPVTTSTEWCPHCQQVVQAECPPTQEWISRLLEDDPAEDWFGLGYRTTAQRQERIRGEVSEAGKPPAPISLVEKYVHSEAAWREWAAENENRPHHCLTCGAETFTPEKASPANVPPLDMLPERQEPSPPDDINEAAQHQWDDVMAGIGYPDSYADVSIQSYWRHPNCGGILMLHDSQMRVSWRRQCTEENTIFRYGRDGLPLR